MYRQLFVFGSRILGLNHVWQLSGKELWEELASKPATAAEPSTKLRHEFEVVSEEYMEILVPKNFNLHKPTTIMLYLHGGGFIEPITALMSRLWTFFSAPQGATTPEKFSKPGFQPKMA